MRNHIIAGLGLATMLIGTAGAIALQAADTPILDLPLNIIRLLVYSPALIVLGGVMWFWGQRLLDNLDDIVTYALPAPGLFAMLGLVTLSLIPDWTGLATLLGVWIAGFLLAVYLVMAVIIAAMSSRRLIRYYRSLRK